VTGTCHPHPANAQTSRVGLTLASTQIQFIVLSIHRLHYSVHDTSVLLLYLHQVGKPTSCHGTQKNPVQCNTVRKRVCARGQQPNTAARFACRPRLRNPQSNKKKLTGEIDYTGRV
jgi:hypothetical protein